MEILEEAIAEIEDILDTVEESDEEDVWAVISEVLESHNIILHALTTLAA